MRREQKYLQVTIMARTSHATVWLTRVIVDFSVHWRLCAVQCNSYIVTSTKLLYVELG